MRFFDIIIIPVTIKVWLHQKVAATNSQWHGDAEVHPGGAQDNVETAHYYYSDYWDYVINW